MHKSKKARAAAANITDRRSEGCVAGDRKQAAPEAVSGVSPVTRRHAGDMSRSERDKTPERHGLEMTGGTSDSMSTRGGSHAGSDRHESGAQDNMLEYIQTQFERFNAKHG